ncbi:DUF1737 domain-containing protein [Gemmata sp. JC673]|uniref:DUF1737 domain-containing protein n=1 Tax=Gemmata algarum TaxID=2975278 RepID=A0ABU5EUS4_9BACT|nr:DUF1737 domain-containing protein [Gemmata algarum]MDY3558886.1 DUF1737 domain-containing protein [Gemmata algarum]
MGYVILENDDALRLTAEVHRRMAQGWKPLGGVSCYYDTRNEAVRYVQALVREPVEPGATAHPTT